MNTSYFHTSKTAHNTHLVEIIEHCFPESVLNVLSEPVLEGLSSAELSLDEEAGGGLWSHSGCYCSLGGLIWSSLHRNTNTKIMGMLENPERSGMERNQK